MTRLLIIAGVFALMISFTPTALYASLCDNNVTKDELEFQWPFSSPIVNIALPYNHVLQLDCCVKLASPSVTWLVNYRPPSAYGDMFTLKEHNQVITTVLYPPTGIYICSVTDGISTINETFIISKLPSPYPGCALGQVGEITKDSPPTDVYDVQLNSSIHLQCTAVITCGFPYMADNVQWWKRSKGSESKLLYALGIGNTYDNSTGDRVNVTYSFTKTSTETKLTVYSTLTIANVTLDDLFYGNRSATQGCESSSATCNSTRWTNDYACVLTLIPSDDPRQKLHSTSAHVMLHATPSTTPAPGPTPAVIRAPEADPKDVKREGIIIGCTLGAFVILALLLALIYSRYEWHIRLYAKRMLLLAQQRKDGKRDYQYDCYVACCRDDEPFVYGVLEEQLERQLQYRLCLPERDFSIGAAIPDQIAHCLENSEHFLAVISPRFWSTDWCSLAVNMALRTNIKITLLHIRNAPEDANGPRNNMEKALISPGCNRIVFRKWRSGAEADQLLLKLQCFLPKFNGYIKKAAPFEARLAHGSPTVM